MRFGTLDLDWLSSQFPAGYQTRVSKDYISIFTPNAVLVGRIALLCEKSDKAIRKEVEVLQRKLPK